MKKDHNLEKTDGPKQTAEGNSADSSSAARIGALLESQVRLLDPRFLKAVQEYAQIIRAGLVPWMKTLVAFAQSVDVGRLTEIASRLESFPEDMREALLALAHHGWFLDMHMSYAELWEVAQTLQHGDQDEAEDTLTNYFRDRLHTIEANVTGSFPHRQKVLAAAFSAHTRAEYELSIPVFLIQADGICAERTKCHLFIRRDKKPSTAIYVEKMESSFPGFIRSLILHPLGQVLPINASQDERGKDFTDLNRHQILHGEPVDYGCEMNGLKAISLLNYVSQVLEPDEDDVQDS